MTQIDGRTKRKRSLGRPRPRWVDNNNNNKMDLR
jgi:hypothetical protein